mgnify:CR=1 FL=1|jgi:hypothetical protein|tara:strand:+ start:4634 stop:5014 length:381 start_codon:yes stop_codon:yes gene_type:complete
MVVDDAPLAQVLDLDDALKQFVDKPDGFLLRLVVYDDEEADISPLTVSVQGFCMSYDLQYRRDLITDQQGRNYTVLDIVGMVGYQNLSPTLKKCDEMLKVIIKSAMSVGLQQPSQAVHFLWTGPEE